MPYLLMRQNVADYAQWKAAFDGSAGDRERVGCKGGQVFQSANDPNEVVALLEWDTMENLQKFAQPDDVKERMKHATQPNPPDVYLLNLADSPSG